MHPAGFFSALFTGIVIGALGRLVVPGRQAIGCLFTILLGILGAVGGAALAVQLDVGGLVTFALQVLVAAVLVALVARFAARW